MQACLVYVNTLLIQEVLREPAWHDRMTVDNWRGLTPLIYHHVNPYGRIELIWKSAYRSPPDRPKPTGFGQIAIQCPKVGLNALRTRYTSVLPFRTKGPGMSRVFAYCRVSTADQVTANQRQEIEAAGFVLERHRIIEECISGSAPSSQRPGFMRLIDRLEPGDVLVVTKLDRLGRNAMDVRATVERLETNQVRVHCLALGGVDLASAAGKMTMQVIAAVAEFERDLLIERTQSGIRRARAQGKRLGRPSRLNREQRTRVLQRLASGTTVAQVAKEFATSRQTILRVRDAMADGAP